MSDLFHNAASSNSYEAGNIEVLEGLEPVRRRQACTLEVGERAFHHLAAEILIMQWMKPSLVMPTV